MIFDLQRLAGSLDPSRFSPVFYPTFYKLSRRKGSGTPLVRLYKDNAFILGHLSQSAQGKYDTALQCKDVGSLHLSMVGLSYRHFAMESVPDPLLDTFTHTI